MLDSSAISEPLRLMCPIAADEARTMPGNGGETHVAMERCDRVLARSTKVPSGTEKADDITGHKRRARGTANTLISVLTELPKHEGGGTGHDMDMDMDS